MIASRDPVINQPANIQNGLGPFLADFLFDEPPEGLRHRLGFAVGAGYNMHGSGFDQASLAPHYPVGEGDLSAARILDAGNDVACRSIDGYC